LVYSDFLERSEIGKKAAVFGMVGNLLLAVFKFAVSLLAHSTVVLADAVDSFSDFLASLLVWFGMKEAVRRPDEEHPYGHGDIEPLAGLIASIILCVLGVEIARLSVSKLFVEVSPPRVFALYAMIPTIFVKEAMVRYTLNISEKIESLALRAVAMNYRGDIYSSLLVVGSLIGARLGFPLLDPLGGFVVSIFIIKMGLEVGRENVRQLIGTVPSPSLGEEIKSLAEATRGVRCVHNIRVHAVGVLATVDLHVCVDESLSIGQAHEIASEIQRRILGRFPEISYALVHIEPYDLHHKLRHAG
jgi:cation diffusion facilitator family transporter